ncbi:hypothetical protein SAMN04487867_104176 [Vreelandella titanicae]|nr:hypothetical protein SAMN04487867_104176 [Halomonas titanicae]
MEELLIEMRKVRKLLEVLVNQQNAEPASPGIIDQTADDARRFGIGRSNRNNAMPDQAQHEECIYALQKSQNGALGIQIPQADCPGRCVE